MAERLTIRADAQDIANAAVVARQMRDEGVPFATRTDAIKLALRLAAERVTQANPRAA